jgi:GntR family transcriptional regulator
MARTTNSEQAAYGAVRDPRGPRRPRYDEIVESLVGRLAALEWRPGDALPGEQALAAEYGVALGTMRKAMDQLVSQNLVTRRQGKGTFVTVHDSARALNHFVRLVSEDGRREVPGAVTKRSSVGSANATEAARLSVRVGARVARFLRLRLLQEKPITVERLVLPLARFPGFDPVAEPDLPPLLYEHYSNRYGIFVVEAIERLRAVIADATEARLLNIPPNSALLQVDRVALDINQVPVEWRLSRLDTRHHYYLNRLS